MSSGSEAVRLPASISASAPRLFAPLPTCRQRTDALRWSERHEAPGQLCSIWRETGWADGAALSVLVKNQGIDYATGKVTDRWTRILHANRPGGVPRLVLPEMAGFTTVNLSCHHGALHGI